MIEDLPLASGRPLREASESLFVRDVSKTRPRRACRARNPTDFFMGVSDI